MNFEQQTAFDLVTQHLAEVTVEMFASYGIVVAPAAATESSQRATSAATIMAKKTEQGDEC